MVLTAKFEGGFCPADCGMRIHIGDEIVRSEEHDAFIHASCAPARSPYELGPRETLCGEHWLVRPCPHCDE